MSSRDDLQDIQELALKITLAISDCLEDDTSNQIAISAVLSSFCQSLICMDLEINEFLDLRKAVIAMMDHALVDLKHRKG